MTNQLVDHSFVADWNDHPVPTSQGAPDYGWRALALWPGLDRVKLRRAHGDPLRIARLVATRTSLPVEAVIVLLLGDS